MKDMEIEKKYLILQVPKDLENYDHHEIEQGYLSVNPVVRVRKSDEEYYLTYKGKGMMAREEYNLPLTKESYEHLIKKADGNVITKTRYLFPLENNLTAELDIFHGVFTGMSIVEVEFESIEAAESFTPPDWFGDEVTYDKRFHNSYLSRLSVSETIL
ncbi:MAG: CYTH domain-containing protein [Lachnospiraceae bacterium]|nr:CYTH domain-containing protein [Lachnospiraceae bacterium]